jgi:lysophospholipase L1-like esterase
VLGDSVPAAAACQCAGFGADLAHVLDATLTDDAVSGQDSAGLVKQLDDPALRRALHSATLVTVTTGANDFHQADASNPSCTNLSCYQGDLNALDVDVRTVLQKIRTLAPAGTTVVLTGYWNVFLDGQVADAKGPTYVAVSNALTLAVNRARRALSAGPDVAYTDLYRPFKGSGTRDDTALLAADGDHPNAAGHHLIARAISATLALQS